MAKADTSKLVLSILLKENRPYAINDLVEKCGKEVGKAAVQKALVALVEHDKVTLKTFNKTNIYFIKQSNELAEIKKELQSCTQKLAQSQGSAKTKQQQLHDLEKKLKTSAGVRSLESLETERVKLLDEIRELNEKIRRHEAQVAETKYTNADVKKIEKQYEHVAMGYRKRKRICTDMLDAIMEGYPKSKKALIDDIGLELDETVGFKTVVRKADT